MAGSHVEVSINISNQKSNTLHLKTSKKEQERIQEDEKIFPSTGGAFVYENQSKLAKNRQIIWRVIDNVIELEEFSLDYNLFSNKLSINVAQEILLPNVVIHECEKEIYIFFSTTRSVHQLILQHPNHNEYGYIIPNGMNVSIPSVFHHVNTKSKHRQSNLTLPCYSFDVVVTIDDIYFVLVTADKTILAVSLLAEEDNCFELKDAGLMQRLWSGLVPSFVRSDTAWMGVESVIVHCFGNGEVYAFTFCRDLKLRVWNILTKTCVLTKDLVSLIPDNLDNQEGIGSLTLKKAKCITSNQLTLAAHCCLAYSSQFIILETFQEANGIVIMHVSSFFSDFNSIQDICITSEYLWALWSTSDGESSLSYAPIEGGKDFERGWHTAHLKQMDKDDIYVPIYQDAKEVYLEKIFSPSSFHKESVIKALQVYTKTNDIGLDLIPDAGSDISTVKESVIQILDSEMEQTLLSMDVQPSEYQELQTQCWSKFYSFVQQFYQLREKPLGIFSDGNNITTLVVRQELCGYLYYHDWIDHLWMSSLESCDGLTSYIDNELDLFGDTIGQDILSIIECSKTIAKQFDTEVLLGIDKDLDGNEDVKTFLTSMASVLVNNSSEFDQLVGDSVERGDYSCQIEGRLKNIGCPQRACEIILTSLESIDFNSSTNLDQSDLAAPQTQFLCSVEGVQFVSNLIQRTVYYRMHLCRDLYVLMTLMEKMNCKIGLNGPNMKDFNILSSGVCYELLRAYHCIYWSSNQTFQKIDANLVDTNLSHLAALNLTEQSPASNSARKVVPDDKNFLYSYLYCFIRDFGLQHSLPYLTESNLNSLKPGDYSSMEMMKLITKACINEIWVLNDKSSDYPEYLASHNQYIALNNFIHLSDNWCTVSRGTKDFLLAQSYIGCNQPEKAFKYFISGARGISQNEPLILKLVEEHCTEENVDNPTDDYKQELLVQYFIKVMRIYERFDYPTYVITTATSAIAIAPKGNKNIPMLWSIIFKYNLELEHYNDSYAAIVHNVDKSRRYDCLRHFVVTLCEHEMFHEICSYPYIGLEEEVVKIIETRARTIDITVNKYYDLLYSYHILKNDYRKASTSMYEQACRLSTEMHGLKSLQKQAKCYLASMTALSLVDEKYAWIVRPQEKFQHNSTYIEKNTSADYSQSPKRKEDGEEVYYSIAKKKKNTKTLVLEMHDLEKDYLLVLARLKLIQYGKNDSIALGPGITPHETVGLLSQIGLYDMAFTVTKKFNLPLKNVFESLAGKCASLTNRNISDFDGEWKWLTLNDINSSQLVSAKSALEQAFHLLQSYLKRYACKSSLLLKAVSSKFLSMGCLLPAWLVIDYQRSNPSELLHLYLSYDMIHEAHELAVKYIDGVLGIGKEYFGLNTALHATTPAVWLPYTYFDELLTALKANYETSDETSIMYDALQEKLNNYFTQLERISCDKLDYLYKVDNRVN